jgi:hypothetical protein
MNTAPNFAKSITLRGKLDIQLLPVRDWRELAARGTRKMTYRISAEAEIEGRLYTVNAFIPAIRDGEIAGLGSATPHGAQEPVEIVSALGPKNIAGIESLRVAVDADGASVIGPDGLPVYEDGQDIPEGYAPFGTAYFCPAHSGLTLRMHECSVRPTDRATKGGETYYNVSCLGYEVIPAESARALGGAVTRFIPVRQSARKTAQSVPAETAVSDIRM